MALDLRDEVRFVQGKGSSTQRVDDIAKGFIVGNGVVGAS